MAHFKNFHIDEINKIKDFFFLQNSKQQLNLKNKGVSMSFGGEENKVTTEVEEKFAGLGAGTYAVTLVDMNTGVSDSTGKQFWVCKLQTEDGKEFDHWITCEETQFKDEATVYKALARQMQALLIYDTIGKHETLEAYVQKAIDLTYQLKGKKVEFTIKPWKLDNKEGLWGQFTGFLDTPNAAIQTANSAKASKDASTLGATTNEEPSFDANEEIAF